MGIVQSGIPKNLALVLRELFSLTEFMETGTNAGETTAWASEYFNQVYSSELAQRLYEKALVRFRDAPNVHLLLGESPAHIMEIGPKLQRPLFWLDAHWSGGNTAGVENECPLVAELNAIATLQLECPVILIDDARLFLAPPPPPHKWDQWPDITRIILACHRITDMYITVADDVIIAVPDTYRQEMAKFLGILYH